MSCNSNNDCAKNKSNIFSNEAKLRLLEYINLDKNIMGKIDTEKLSDYDKFVMQHDEDIECAIKYIDDLEKRWIEEVKVNCSNETKINKLETKINELETKLKSAEVDYNTAMEINSTIINRNNILVEENDTLKRYIDEVLARQQNVECKSNDTINEMLEAKEKAEELKINMCKEYLKTIPISTITIENNVSTKIVTGQDMFNKEIIDVIETITESVDDCYIPTTLAKLRELQKQIETDNGRKYQ